MQHFTKADIAHKSRPVFQKHGIRRAGLFGSFARGEQNEHSDLDFIVEFSGKANLFVLGELKDDLETAFGMPCDVLTYTSVEQDQSELATSIQREVQVVYDER